MGDPNTWARLSIEGEYGEQQHLLCDGKKLYALLFTGQDAPGPQIPPKTLLRLNPRKKQVVPLAKLHHIRESGAGVGLIFVLRGKLPRVTVRVGPEHLEDVLAWLQRFLPLEVSEKRAPVKEAAQPPIMGLVGTALFTAVGLYLATHEVHLRKAFAAGVASLLHKLGPVPVLVAGVGAAVYFAWRLSQASRGERTVRVYTPRDPD